MNKFEIEMKKDVEFEKDSPLLNQYKTMYQIKSEGFEADVIVFHKEPHSPFIHQHLCKKGGDLLWRFGFWAELQNHVLFYHLNKMEEKQNEKESS